MNDKQIEKIICCYCGERVATTKDHIPPKSIFVKPRPNDLITVPCCQKCNNEASKTDELFKAYLGMHVARNGGDGERLFMEGVLATTKHNNKLRKNILQSFEPVYLTTKSGIITGKAIAVPWNNNAHDKTIERLVRGLFFHHYKKVIPLEVVIKIYWFDKEINDPNLFKVFIANGNFIYKYNKAFNSEFDSVWLFNFYKSHFAGGVVLE